MAGFGDAVEKTRRRIRWIRQLQVSIHSGHTCYFLILSAFPALALLLGLLRHTRLQPADLMELFQDYLPGALRGYVWQILRRSYENTSSLVLSLSALTALWSAGKGIYGMIKGLNRIWDLREHRGWLRTRLLCVGYLVLFLLVLVLTLVLYVFSGTITAYLGYRGGTVWENLGHWRFFLLVGIQTLVFCGAFMYLPAQIRGFRESLPGALLASLGWMGTTGVFSRYMAGFGRYESIFGPVYALALGMLWLYVCVSVIFYGAVFNRILAEGWESGRNMYDS